MTKKEDARKSNIKVIWYILFAVVLVLLCYLFVVVFFYYISPYNISAKLAIWPFASDESIGQMYLDATVEIDFSYYDSDEPLNAKTGTAVGVNVRKDGYVLVPYTEVRDALDDGTMKVKTNSSGIYGGSIIYFDENYNLAVVKCEKDGVDIKIPYVKISNTIVSTGTEILATASPLQTKTVWSGEVTDSELSPICIEKSVDETSMVDVVMENCQQITLNQSYTGGAVFDKNGNLLGLSFDRTLSSSDDGEPVYALMPVYASNNFLDDVIDSYEQGKKYTNSYAQNLVGFDQEELAYYQAFSSENGDRENFYYNGEKMAYTSEINAYIASSCTGYFLLESLQFSSSASVPANCAISSFLYDGMIFKITNKLDLLDVLYAIDSGDKLTVNYYEFVLDEQSQEMSQNQKVLSFVAGEVA